MIRLATVGTSWITQAFIQSALLSKQYALTAVYSRSEENAKELADIFNVGSFYNNLDEMARSTEIDTVYIASPNSLHFEQTLLFLKNKKHVICEKPIFSNTAEWDDAIKVAEENGVYLFEATRNIHTPNFQILREKLGMAGQLRSAILPYMKYSSRYDQFLQGEEPNIFSTAFSGGALVDLGVYPVTLAVALFGEPKKVTYHPFMLRSGVDGGGALVLDYDGFVCTILCSKVSHSIIPCEIHGESGTFVLEDAAPISEIKFYDSRTKESHVLSVAQEEHDMVYECLKFAEIISARNDDEFRRLKNWSRAVLRITEEARKQSGILFEGEKID